MEDYTQIGSAEDIVVSYHRAKAVEMLRKVKEHERKAKRNILIKHPTMSNTYLLVNKKRAEELEKRSKKSINKGENTCPNCGSILIHQSGCCVCPACGWSACDN